MYAKRLVTLQSYLFAAIDETKGNAIESGVDVIDLIVGSSFRGHEFHHSSVTDIPGDATFAIRLTRGVGIMVENTLAGYAHPLYVRICGLLRRLSMHACNAPKARGFRQVPSGRLAIDLCDRCVAKTKDTLPGAPRLCLHLPAYV